MNAPVVPDHVQAWAEASAMYAIAAQHGPLLGASPEAIRDLRDQAVDLAQQVAPYMRPVSPENIAEREWRDQAVSYLSAIDASAHDIRVYMGH